LGKKKKLILSVGSLVKAKDLPTLLKAAKLVIKKYPKTIFVIAGEGPERRKLEKMINEFGLEDTVRLVGSIAYAKLPELYASADLFVLSSSHEGFPRVLMEAALTRLPIVTTRVDGASELVENQKSGLLVPIASSQKLAEAMIDLLGHPKKAKEMAAVAQKNARKLLDFDRVVKRVVTSWKGLVR
jgi:phosphatidylinositol alpha-1,6-mannosyltransferase